MHSQIRRIFSKKKEAGINLNLKNLNFKSKFHLREVEKSVESVESVESSAISLPNLSKSFDLQNRLLICSRIAKFRNENSVMGHSKLAKIENVSIANLNLPPKFEKP